MNANDYDSYDEDEEQDQPQHEPTAPAEPTYQPAAATPLANPVLRSFETPAAAATNTTPPAAQSASVAPAQPAPQPTAPATQPAPAPAQPASAAPSYAAYQAAAPTSTGRPPVTEALARQNQQRLDDLFAQEHEEFQAHKAAGGQVETLPNGYQIIKRDADGNDLYHPAVTQPFTRLADGTAYRVTRNEYGTSHYFPLAQGQEGADYHVDPNTGDKYVDTTGADGTSRREIIGQDATVSALNSLKGQYQGFQAAKQTIDLDESRAANGVQGGTALQANSVGDLRDESKKLTADVTRMQKQLDNVLPDDPASTPTGTLSANQQLADQLAHKKQRLAAVQQELDGRDSVIADARQRRDALTGQHIDTNTSLGVLHQVRATGGLEAYQSDLTTLAQGGKLTTDQAGQQRVNLLTNLGLLRQEPTDDGTGTEMRLTPAGVAALDPALQKSIAASPEQYTTTDENAAVDPRLARAGQSLASLLNPAGASDDSASDSPAKKVAAPGASGVAASLPKTLGPLAMYEGKVLAPPQARQQWVNFQALAVARVPDIGVAGSPANLAFVRAFRASGGDAKRAMQAVQLTSKNDRR